MLKRTITGLVLTAILVPLLIVGKWFFAVAVALIAYLANYELLDMFAKKTPILKKLKVIMPIWSSATILFSYSHIAMLLPCVVMGILLFLLGMVLNKHVTADVASNLIFSYFYGGCLPGLILWLREINLYIVALVFVTVMLTDVGGYIFGFLFGKHKLCPTISPKKTIEGAVLGTLFGMGLGCGLYFIVTKVFDITILTNISKYGLIVEILIVLGITLLLAIVGQLGDLVASKIKRANDIKDFGKIFPGHGGVLDRFDSTIIASAMMFVICYLIGVI